MGYLALTFKIVIFISIINVWFIRFNKSTPWRGGEASSMREEFVTYGLSETMMYLVGGLKVLSATALLVSIWIPVITTYAAGVMVILMVCAIAMHVRVNDSLKKSIPAFIFLLLSVLLIINSQGYF